MSWPTRRRRRESVHLGEERRVSERRNGADQQLVLLWRGCRQNPGTGALADPFAVNPIRRSLALVVGCALVVFGPWFVSGELATTVMLSVGWLAVTGLVMGIPVLLWSLTEEAVRMVRVRLRPPIARLDISPRVLHILARHGYDSIESVDAAPDAALLLLSNMDTRGLREVRRAITLWKYRRWQEKGFPAVGD